MVCSENHSGHTYTYPMILSPSACVHRSKREGLIAEAPQETDRIVSTPPPPHVIFTLGVGDDNGQTISVITYVRE